MAALKYRDEHNKIGFLEKSKGSTDYDQVIDFLLDSHIRYAIVSDPLIYDSLIKQFWSTASLLTSESGPPAIVAKIDGTPYTITESLVRSSLLLNDEGGIVDMSIAEIYTVEVPDSHSLALFKYKVRELGSIWKSPGHCFDMFLQMILNIETRNTKPYRAFRLTSKMFANMRLNFHGDPMPLVASMLAPAQPAIAGESSGEAEPSVPPNVPETVTETVHSHEQVSTPPRPAPTNTDAQQNEQGPFSDPTSTQAHDSIPDPVPSTNVEDESLGGTFFATPPRSPAAPPKGTTSRGAADPLNLTALCTLVCEQGKKIENLESELQAHKLLFKEVMGKLDCRGNKIVDPLIKLAKAAATAADTSSIPADDNQTADIPPGSSTPTMHLVVATNVLLEQEERQRKRQEDVLNSAKYYTDDDWIHIMGQVHANQGLTADLLGPDVTEENLQREWSKLLLKGGDSLKNRGGLLKDWCRLWTTYSKKSKSNEAQHTSVPPASNPSTAGVPSNPSPFVHNLHTAYRGPCGYRTEVNPFDDDIKNYSTKRGIIPTGLGDVNALYFTDKTSKYFTHLREILHLIDRQDLSKLFGMVVKHYEVNPLAGNGLILWGDLHVLFESTSGGSSVDVWNDQQEWVIHSWKLFPSSGVHVLETLIPFHPRSSLLLVFLLIDSDSEFMLWNSLLLLECSSSSYFAAVSILKLTLPTGRVIATDSVIVATSGYVVPAAYDISPGRVK
ncbi:hypothetical protein Tco_0788521 [Tanacetum coccineum]